MTVSSTQSIITFAGDGVTTTFDIPFIWGPQTDLVVTDTNNSTGVVTTLNNPADYQVTGGIGQNGEVDTTNPPLTGHTLTVRRDASRLQPIDLRNQGSLLPEVLERGLDTAMIAIQDVYSDGNFNLASLNATAALFTAFYSQRGVFFNFLPTGQDFIADLSLGKYFFANSANILAGTYNVLTPTNAVDGDVVTYSFTGNGHAILLNWSNVFTSFSSDFTPIPYPAINGSKNSITFMRYNSQWFEISREEYPATAALAYSASITPNTLQSRVFLIQATNNSAFTIQNSGSVTQKDGFDVTFLIQNNTGGGLGTLSWGTAWHLASTAWVQPSPTKLRMIRFMYNKASNVFYEVSRSLTDLS